MGVGSIPMEDCGSVRGSATIPPGCALIFLFVSVMADSCCVPKPTDRCFLLSNGVSSFSLVWSDLRLPVT